jgi:hypothetical protein
MGSWHVTTSGQMTNYGRIYKASGATLAVVVVLKMLGQY